MQLLSLRTYICILFEMQILIFMIDDIEFIICDPLTARVNSGSSLNLNIVWFVLLMSKNEIGRSIPYILKCTFIIVW